MPVKELDARETMKRLVRTLVDAIVADPQHVMVLAKEEGSGVSVHVVAPDDELGRLIGRNGQTARALRVLVSAAGARHGVTCELSAGPYAQSSKERPVQ